MLNKIKNLIRKVPYHYWLCPSCWISGRNIRRLKNGINR